MQFIWLLPLVPIIFGQSLASPTHDEVYAGGKSHGAVASEVDVCSRIGAYEIKKGGNAVDSIIATVLCVGVIDAFHSGIGGGMSSYVTWESTRSLMMHGQCG